VQSCLVSAARIGPVKLSMAGNAPREGKQSAGKISVARIMGPNIVGSMMLRVRDNDDGTTAYKHGS